ncbi:MAG: hypothetical protein GY940_40965 [bacterium]|nr:hypothetical protein [bacterium]
MVKIIGIVKGINARWVKILGIVKGIKTKSGTIKTALKNLGAKETKTEFQIQLSGDILFDFDKWDIKPGAEETLKKVSIPVACPQPSVHNLYPFIFQYPISFIHIQVNYGIQAPF